MRLVRLLQASRWAVSKLESKVQREAIVYASSKGCMTLKLNVLGRRGWPDTLFLYPVERMLLVEFKREGLKASKLQAFIHKQIRKYGFKVEVIDNLVDARAAIDRLTSEKHFE